MKNSLLSLAILSLAGSAFAQPNSAALSTELAVQTIEAAAPAIEALALHPTPATQKITAPTEMLDPLPMLPKAMVQVKKLAAADAARLAAVQRWEQTGVADALVGAGGAVEYPLWIFAPDNYLCTIARLLRCAAGRRGSDQHFDW